MQHVESVAVEDGDDLAGEISKRGRGEKKEDKTCQK